MEKTDEMKDKEYYEKFKGKYRGTFMRTNLECLLQEMNVMTDRLEEKMKNFDDDEEKAWSERLQKELKEYSEYFAEKYKVEL